MYLENISEIGKVCANYATMVLKSLCLLEVLGFYCRGNRLLVTTILCALVQ